MKCPNCGNEMTENTLYCEHCGEDIHIVPDFEPDIDLHLEQFITEISDEVKEKENSKQHFEFTPQNSKFYFKSRQFLQVCHGTLSQMYENISERACLFSHVLSVFIESPVFYISPYIESKIILRVSLLMPI